MRLLLVSLLPIVACRATPPPTHPADRGLRASQHAAEARDHDARAAELARWPEQRGLQDADGQVALGRWSRLWDTKQTQEQHARVHRGEAAALLAELDEACREIPAADITRSPLHRFGIGGAPTANGVTIYLSTTRSPDALMTELRCHRAWMMLGPMTMSDCPLDLPGIHVDAKGNAGQIMLKITVHDPALVPELQRRAALDLESTDPYRGNE